jgi:hypothetical protein
MLYLLKDIMPENTDTQTTERAEETGENTSALNGVAAKLFDEYSDEPQPHGSHLTVIAIYTALLSALLLTAERKKVLPKQTPWGDLLLLGIATHKLSRLMTKATATSAIRAPFTRYERPSPIPGELHEEPRGEGVQQTVGELLTCPFCLGTWIATAFTGGLMLAPGAARAVGSIFTVLAISDFLHNIYATVSDQGK